MGKSYRRMCRVLAILLAGAVFLSNQNMYSVSAAKNKMKEEGLLDDASKEGIIPQEAAYQEWMSPDSEEDRESPEDRELPEDGEDSGADKKGTVSGNVPGSDTCLPGKEHEYEEILAQDGTIIYQCVFCQRRIDAEIFMREKAVYHKHLWNRAEGEIIPVCQSCGAERLDCIGEEGYGIHIFELVGEEGQPDRYRCVVCGIEKEVLDEWDLTVEEFRKIMDISLYAETYRFGDEISELPTNQAELKKYKGTTFLVKNLADLMALQELSQNDGGFDFDGYSVQFIFREQADGKPGENGGRTWDLTPLKGFFHGIGSKEAPFKGTLTSSYDYGTLRFRTAMPLLDYAATGATVSKLQISADIAGDGTGPAGAIAAHVIAADGADEVTVFEVSVSGKVLNPGGAAGVLFGEVENTGKTPVKLCYEESSKIELGIPGKGGAADAPADAEGAYAGGLAGRIKGAAEVYKTDVFPMGTMTGTVCAGMLAGSMEDGGILYVDGADDEKTVHVGGSGVSGGLAGRIEKGKVIQDAGKKQSFSVTGNVTGSSAGGLVGECIDTEISLENIKVSADVIASAKDAGGVIGYLKGKDIGNANGPDWHLLHHITVTGNVSGGTCAGGVAGRLEGSNFRIGLPGEADNFQCIQVEGMVSAPGAAGGMIGEAKGEYIEIYHASLKGGVKRAAEMGGMIGSVGDGTKRSVVKVTNAAVTSSLNPEGDNKIQGGIYGNIHAGSMAALDRNIDVRGLEIAGSSLQRGYIAGKQEEALVYFEENSKYQRTEGKDWTDNIGSYGGVYKNGNWGENAPLISYAEKAVKGTVTSSGNEWVLDTEADVIRLAIMLNSEGRFAGNCFPGANKGTLLGADYSLKNPADGSFDLEESGIYSLNRNDRGKAVAECFTGKLVGAGKATWNMGVCTTYQSYLSLFPYAGEGAQFQNLTINREIRYAREAAAGLCAYASGNIKVHNVDMQLSLTGSREASPYLYGGMFAHYSAGGDVELSVTQSRIGGRLEINQSTGTAGEKQYGGGLLAKYEADPGAVPAIKIQDLELAGEIVSSSRFVSGMVTQINTENEQLDKDGDRVRLALKNITVSNGAKMTIQDSEDTGGFLGWKWYGVAPDKSNYSINGLTMGNGGTADDGPAYSTEGNYGGLVHTVTGRIQLKDVKIQNASFHAAPGGSNHNGLLFHNGHKALIELEGYQIAGQDVGARNINYAANNAKVRVTGATDQFSEIVGNNMGRDKNNRNYTMGGIVNIISPAFSSGFVVYRSHLLNDNAGSDNTRYYYNLFGASLADGDSFMAGKELDGAAVKLTDVDQIMVWHLSQYMNDSIRRYLKPYFVNEAVPEKNRDITISGEIDLNRISYYPTPVENCTVKGEGGAKIVFHGDKITPSEITPAEEENRPRRENYMLQGGLLLSPNGGMRVEGDKDFLTLAGKITRLGFHSGALFCMSVKGTNQIYRIQLEDLYMNNYGGAAHGYGLLIGAIEDNSDIDISWIQTKGYNGSSRQQKYAASALIGSVGNTWAKNLRLDFTNIKVGSKNPDKNPADKSEGIFRFAVFIDIHQYTDHTQENKGRVRYLFTEEAYKGLDMADTGNSTRDPFIGGIHGDNNYKAVGGYVTVGNELKNGVEYWNTEGEADLVAAIADWDMYLPYVCTSHTGAKSIQVNPKNVSITEGCGTYEDPYQINNAKQLLALSYYLTNGKNQQYLEGWQIRKPGDKENVTGGNICTKVHTKGTLRTYGDGGFPTEEELRKAYYVITKDIDFSELRGSGDAALVQSFVGLGTETFPFSGVIAGEEYNGTFPTVTLPHKRKGNTSNYYGLIQFAKGAVIKDLRINSPKEPENDNDLLTNVARVSNSGGSAIACILGGDNIIDNVAVKSLIAVDTAEAGKDAAVGGYVGTLQQGSLILRNLSEDNLSGFRWGLLKGGNEQMESGTLDLSDYPYVSGTVGKVENGFVIYEGSLSGDVALPHGSTDIPNIYKHDVLPFSNTYDVITAAGMAGEKGSIPINFDGKDYTCNIANGAQLQLVSMAINSDSFSVYYDGGGYDKKASCRKARYDGIGNVTDLTEYENATKKDDNVYWYPYIYQYFIFDGNTAGSSSAGTGFYRTLDDTPAGYRSRLNAVTSAVSASMTYTLTDDSAKEIDYDLSVYGRGFRGLGATYRVFKEDTATADLTPRNGIYSDFRANFNGNGATVKAWMENDYAKGIHTAALFNDLVNTDAVNSYSISNVVVTGTFKSSNAMEGNTAKNYSADRAAAVVGMMRRPWEISKVTAKNVEVWSKGHAAGIVAWINLPSNNEKNKKYSFTDCQVLSAKDSMGGKGVSIHTVGGSSGGIIGIMGSWHTDALNGYELEMNGCRVQGEDNNGSQDYYVSIENEGDRTGMDSDMQEGNARGRCGALAGHVGKHHEGSAETKIKLTVTGKNGIADVQYAALKGGGSTGGIIGEYYGWRENEKEECIKISDITVSDCIIESKNRNETRYGVFGVGGMIGKLQRKAFCKIMDTEVMNTNIRSVYDLKAGAGSAVQDDIHAGGLIGSFYWQSKIEIDGARIRGDLKDGTPQYEILSCLSNAGGLIGASVEDEKYSDNNRSHVVITDTEVSEMNILSDNRGPEDRVKDSGTGTSKGAAGGMAGLVTMTTMRLQKSAVEKCVIRSGSGAAGGVIGQAGTGDGNTATWADTVLDEVTVDACTVGTNGNISDMAANAGCGGIYGSIYAANDKGSQKLGKVSVENCNIYGKNTGGIAGTVCDSQQIGNVWSDEDPDHTAESQDHTVSVSNSRLLGYAAGGVFGADKSKKTCFDQVKISENVIAGLGDSKVRGMAGGFGGRKGNSENADDCHNINNVTVENNRIFSNDLSGGKRQNAGGLFGYLDLDKEIYSYHAVIKDNWIGYCDVAENNLLGTMPEKQMEKMIACLDGLKNEEVKIWDGNQFGALPAKLTEEDLNKYAGYFGNIAGGYEGSGHAYFLMPEVVYTDGNATRPVVDVGSEPLSGTPGNRLLSSPYAYRENIHVVYHEPDLLENKAAEVWKNAPMGRNSLFSQVNADAELEEYAEAVKNGKANQLLDAYRLQIEDDNGNTVEEIYQKVYKDKNGYLSELLVNQEKLPMIVIDTQYGTVDQLMWNVLALLTGAGGIHNSGESSQNENYDYGISRIMDVSVKPMIVRPDGTIEEDTDPHRKSSMEWNKNENGRAELSYRAFDEKKEDGSGTFSLLTVTYKQDDYTGMDAKTVTGEKIELQIPVFVIERLTIDTYLKMVEGEVYNADKAKKEGVSKDPLLANDSSYTLYMEYIYGSARNTYSTKEDPICIDKTLGITYLDANGNAVPAKFWAGTRLTLIDVCDSNKVYYYTVQDKDTVIKFSQFMENPKDPGSARYKNKPIHGEEGKDIYENGKEFPAEDMDKPYTDVAVERFLIIVDTALVDEELKLTTRNARDYHITPELEDEISKRTTLTEHTDLSVTMQPGLTLGFVSKGKENGTDVKGSIQDREEVVVNATFEIAGEKEYWLRALNSQITTIDSANHNKYLEVGVYLADVNGNRVRLPDNTNVTVNGIRLKPWEEEIKPEENIGSYVNRTAVYFYKDGKIQFSLDALKDMIRKDMEDNGVNQMEGMISEHLKVALNFANADLTGYTENNYVVHLELLRVEDAGYPAGGELLDTYEQIVAAKRKTDMACALETKDLMELGINTYQKQTSMPHEIHFDFKLDFSGVISSNEMTNQQIADKYYTVTYHILEKTNRDGTPDYKPYVGSQLSLALADPPASDEQKALEKGSSSTGQFRNSQYVTYHFGWNEIKKGTGDAGSGVITRDLVLTVKDAAKMNLSNYKIQASVMISDTPLGDIEQDVNKALSDFFVFTVAKLKTDLDY